MGISCLTRNTYSILSLHLLLILIITPPSSSFTPTDIVTKETLNKLCSQSILYNRRFCIKWLSADNRTTSINFHGLMELAAEKAQAFGQENLELMNDFARISGKDKQFKNACVECVKGYDVAIKELELAKEFLRKRSFQQAFYAASKAVDYAYVCKDQFEGPSNEPPFVLDRSVKFITMCHIVRFFTSLFN
ncbi:Plant invertase/pectin methylesterase inhibitor superfamily protein [Raphanus sativus]|uniref:Pectinesterase inhibitor n=1 Tax=Raphanus sativus TaxID=3726 RepID=A0A6J0JI34_RAPSA|nr:pectinesterase inhibitor [Raphanus sativus]KAJ4886118.1 Plant invertase/pectin methylesterase inhibitor superfamily protein [Raphanus sativus]